MTRTRRCPITLLAVLLVTVLSTLYAPVSAAQSSTLVVTKLDDTDDGVCDQDCSLREAIANVTANATITFTSNLKGTITLKREIRIVNKSVAINGPGVKSDQITLSGNNAHVIFNIGGDKFGGAELHLSNLTLVNGKGGAGGAIIGTRSIITVTNSFFRNNRANLGGAIANYTGPITIIGCTFEGNHANFGGSLINYATVAITNSTFHEDEFEALANPGGELTISSSTIQVNDTRAIFNIGGLANPQNSVTTLQNTIVTSKSNFKVCEGPIFDGGNNLQFPNADCGSTIPVGDPKLGPLTDNGGPTLTIALQPGSAAIGKVPPDQCPETDQRGYVRKDRNAPCDIGAFQTGYVAPTATPTP